MGNWNCNYYKSHKEPEEHFPEEKQDIPDPILAPVPEKEKTSVEEKPKNVKQRWQTVKNTVLSQNISNLLSNYKEKEKSNILCENNIKEEKEKEREKERVTTITTNSNYGISIFETEEQDLQPSNVYYEKNMNANCTRIKPRSATVSHLPNLEANRREAEIDAMITKNIQESGDFDKLESVLSKFLKQK